MTRDDVAVVSQALRDVRAGMDGDTLAQLRGVRVTVKPYPDADDLQRGCIPTQKACFWGIGCEQGIQGSAELPDPSGASGEIILFLDNLQPVTPERARVVLLHEYAHAMGHDEDLIRAMGLWLDDGAPDACTPF